jgi:hypothetical protein
MPLWVPCTAQKREGETGKAVRGSVHLCPVLLIYELGSFVPIP